MTSSRDFDLIIEQLDNIYSMQTEYADIPRPGAGLESFMNIIGFKKIGSDGYELQHRSELEQRIKVAQVSLADAWGKLGGYIDGIEFRDKGFKQKVKEISRNLNARAMSLPSGVGKEGNSFQYGYFRQYLDLLKLFTDD